MDATPSIFAEAALIPLVDSDVLPETAAAQDPEENSQFAPSVCASSQMQEEPGEISLEEQALAARRALPGAGASTADFCNLWREAADAGYQHSGETPVHVGSALGSCGPIVPGCCLLVACLPSGDRALRRLQCDCQIPPLCWSPASQREAKTVYTALDPDRDAAPMEEDDNIIAVVGALAKKVRCEFQVHAGALEVGGAAAKAVPHAVVLPLVR